MKKSSNVLIILGIIFVSFNLRPALTSVGSIISLIKEDYNLTSSMAGFITTLPLIAFAVFSPFVSKISSKFGYGLTMLSGLVLIVLGAVIRSYTNMIGLFLGTAIIGIGIAIGNVLIPSIIKLKFSHKVGTVTSLYTTFLCVFAALGSGFSVPLAQGVNLGWRNALAFWIIPALITMIIWFPQLKICKNSESNNAVKSGKSSTNVWKSNIAWWVTLFMGTQSLLFYCLVSWLPSMITWKGMTPEFAGTMALFFQLVGLPATLLMPIIASKFKDQRMITTLSSLVYLLGMVLFLVSSSQLGVVASLLFLGIGMGSSISLSIVFISLRSPNALVAGDLSGMSQSAGYLLAAVGPFLLGLIFDITTSWIIPLMLLISFVVFLIICGLKAGSNIVIDEGDKLPLKAS